MPEITILEAKTKKNLENLSEDEREFAVMQMSKQVSYIPDKYWNSFAQMITKNIHRKEIISNMPTMRELIFRNIISVSKTFVENKMPYFLYKGILPSLIATRYIVTPIIEDFTYKLDISKKDVISQNEDIFSSYSSSIVAPSLSAATKGTTSQLNPKLFSMPSTANISKNLKTSTSQQVQGGWEWNPQYKTEGLEWNSQDKNGVFGSGFRRSKGSQHSSMFGQPKLRRNVLEKDIRMSIRVRFEYPVCCVTETGVFYIAPTQEEISVIGFALGNMCGRIGNDFMPFLIELIKTGVISYEQLASNCIEDVILQTAKSQQNNTLQPLVFAEINPLNNMFLFSENVQKVDEEMYVILNDLISKYDFSYSLDAHRISNEIAISVAYSSIGSKLFSSEKVQTGQNAQSVQSVQNTPINQEIIDQMDVIYKATGYKPSTTYYDSFIYTLRNMNALDLFHKCLVFGKDSKPVKAAIDTIKNDKLNLSFLASIEKKLTEANYKASVVFSIVKTLFGEQRASKLRTEAGKSGINGDLVMQFLTQREREYVTNELKRRESYLLAISGNKCPHIGVLRRLRGARSDEESTRAYNELKAFFPKGILGGRGVKYAGAAVFGGGEWNSHHSGGELRSPKNAIFSGERVSSPNTSELSPKFATMIKCEVCKFDLICPHLVEIIELKTHKMPPNQIRATLNKYIDDKPLHENYYCKICGEFLVTSDVYDNSMTESDARVYSNIADELKTLMWSEIAGIIKYLDVSVFINIPKFISSVITGIYDFIFEIEKQLIRSKTNTAEDVNNKKKLFIVVYAYAYIIDMIMKSDGAIKFKAFANIDKPKPSDLIQFVKYAVITIINTKNIIINQIANITTDQIVEKIRDAYKNIAALKHKKHDIHADEEEIDLYALLFNDPLYQYYYYANMLGTGKARKKLNDMKDKVEYIMGDTLDNKQDSEKKSNKDKKENKTKKTAKNKVTKVEKPLFETAKAPNFANDPDVIYFESILNNFGVAKNNVTQDIKPETLNKIIRGYKKKSFAMLYDNIRKRTFSKFIFEKDTIQSANNTEDVEISKLSKEFIEAENAAKKVKLCESFLYNLLGLSRVIGVNSWERFAGFYTDGTGVSDVSSHRFLRDFHRVPIKLGNLFDEAGQVHNFSKFVFAAKDNKTQVEVTAAELGNKAQKTSSRGDLGPLIGRKCSICGVMEDLAADLNESRINSALKEKTISENFFKFYLNRCPFYALASQQGAKAISSSEVGRELAPNTLAPTTILTTTVSAIATHNWVLISNGSDSECSQCKLLQSTQYNVMSTGKQNQESKAYYEKYSAVYLRELAKDIEMRKSEPTIKSALYKVPNDVITKLEKWSFNYNIIADLSAQLGFNANAFMSIGAHEKVEYEDIKSGKYTPGLIENYDNTRFNSILGYIQLLITEYNNLRNYHAILKPSDDIKNIVESSQIKRHEISELEQLAEIGTTFSADYKNARRVLRPNTLIEYLLETLAFFISAASTGYTTITKSADTSLVAVVRGVCKNFATEFVKKMLRNEELKTAYTQINWNVFKLKDNRSVDDVIETEKYDTNLDDEAGIENPEDDAEDKGEKGDKEDTDDKDEERGDTIDIMKNKFDIDLDPDQDFEDFDNEIGEESELL